MIAGSRIGFDPALPLGVMIALGVLALLAWALYVWRGGGAPVLRALGLALVFIGLMQPQWVRETREPAQDVALVVIDQSESLALAGRREAARAAGDEMARRLGEQSGLDVRVREARGGPDGTMIASLIEDALADVARERIGGVVVVTDGQAADAPDPPAAMRALGPAHVLIVGDPERGDRRIELISAPTFGIVGEAMRVTGRVIDARGDAQVRVRVSIDSARDRTLVRANREFAVNVILNKRGRNMVIMRPMLGLRRRGNNLARSRQWRARPLRVLLVTGSRIRVRACGAIC